MVGRLQYSATGAAGSQNDLATIRPMRGREYKVEAVTGKNRNDDVEILCYKITVQITLCSLPANFLDNDQYNFRIYFNYPDRIYYNSKVYECKLAHLSSSLNEPENYYWIYVWKIVGGNKDHPTWQSGIYYYKDYEIDLGQRKYTHDFNAQLQMQDINQHIIGIEFTCNPDDVGDYIEKTGIYQLILLIYHCLKG